MVHATKKLHGQGVTASVLFNSFSYLLFLPAVVLIFWMSPQKFRTPLLLVASYAFYMSWKPIYGLLIVCLTLINYLFGLAIHHSKQNRKALLIAAIAANLIILGYFKYAYFTLDLVNHMLPPTGAHLPAFPWEIILPLGISFFVFEFIHYIAEVYKGGAPVKSFPAFALFASFFPTQIAGPIKRYQDFIPQLSLAKHFEMAQFEEGVHLILFGLFKKVLFADNLAVVVQSAFQHPYFLSSIDMWLAVYAFAFQIYFDFSGYTDIARGSALLLGFKVPPNFNLPYLSGSISEFWHRWHISLSTWLRDYLFIPLGGSKCSRLLNHRNLLITMILGGLWHGAAMHFVVWGAYHGVLLLLHKEYQRLTAGIGWFAKLINTKVFHIASVILTFHLVCIGWVFFRADTIKSAWDILGKLCFLSCPSQTTNPWDFTIAATSNPVIFLLLPIVLILLFAGQLVGLWWSHLGQKPTFPKALKAVYVTLVLGLLLVFSPDTSPRFIYFQF